MRTITEEAVMAKGERGTTANLLYFKLRSRAMQLVNFIGDNISEIKLLVILGIQYGQNMEET
jgi:hypothetical protein